VAVGVVAIMKGEKDLKKITPDGVLRYWSLLLLRLLDYCR